MNTDLINYLKKDFKESLFKGIILKEQEILEKVIDYNGAEEELNYFRTYYKDIVRLELILEIYDFEEIIFLGHQNYIIKKDNTKTFYPFPYDSLDFEIMLQILAIKNAVDWNYNSPFASFKTILHQQTMRATLIHGSLESKESSRLFLRKIEDKLFSLDNFTSEVPLLKELVTKKKNFIICGPTGSGKTTLMSSLLSFISKDDHVITIEDTEELNYKNKFYTPLIASSKNSMNDLLTYSLRMTPDRIILGEMRSKEITTFLLAMNTGHNGLISTLHANSASDAIDRMALMFTLYQEGKGLTQSDIVRLISKSVDFVIYIENKKVKEVVQILGSENGVPYFRDMLGEERVFPP